MDIPESRPARPRILVVVAVAMTVRAFLLNYLRALADGHDVTVVCSGDSRLAADLPPGVSFVPINIRRNINPIGDLLSLIGLVRFMRSEHFDMVHSVTPKAGLLAQLSAWWCGIAIRVHTFTGQIWATRRGVSRAFLKAFDWLIAACATHLLADSASQRDFLVSEGVVGREKIDVLGHGSISGVDAHRFRPDQEVRQAVRSRLGYGDDDVLALFVGRLNRDKGVLDLAAAFARVAVRQPRLALLLVGPDEAGLIPEIMAQAGGSPRLRALGGTPRPEEFMAAADFFCLPSYREGFGSVVIEAAACGLPGMVSAIYGLTDAVEDGVSGVFHAPHDVDAIAALLERFASERAWRERLGRQARERALGRFSAEAVVEAQLCFVRTLIGRVA